MEASAAALRRPYAALAALLNCSAGEIAVVSSATAAWQQVTYGLAWRWRKRDRVIAGSSGEYGSNAIALLQLAQRTGAVLEVAPETAEGDVDVAALARMLAAPPRPVLVSLSHVPTSSGRVYDAAAVGAACRAAGVPFLLDACQSVGQLPVDVQAIGCDFLCGTGRKYLRAPRGSGFLYARRRALRGLQVAWGSRGRRQATLVHRCAGATLHLTARSPGPRWPPACLSLQRVAGPAGAGGAGQCGCTLGGGRPLRARPRRRPL